MSCTCDPVASTRVDVAVEPVFVRAVVRLDHLWQAPGRDGAIDREPWQLGHQLQELPALCRALGMSLHELILALTGNIRRFPRDGWR